MTNPIEKHTFFTEEGSTVFNVSQIKENSFRDQEQACILQMNQNGFYNVEEPLDMSGSLIKFAGRTNSKEKTEWYKASLTKNGNLQVTYNSHHSSLQQDKHYVFSSKSNFPVDELKLHERVTNQQINRESDTAHFEERKRKAKIDQNRFDQASENGTSPYLTRKQIGTHGIRFDFSKQETVILVPMRDQAGEIQALQEIYPTKRAFKSGEKPRDKNFTNSTKGLFHTIGNIINGDPIRISEGYATASSCYESTENKIPHVIAFSAGAYQTVIPILRKLYPNSPLLICADNNEHDDHQKNIGLREAEKATKLVTACSVVWPTFPTDKTKNEKGERYADFNDLMIISGKNEVKRQIENMTQILPEIEIIPGNISHITDEAEKILVATKSDIYQRSGRLVRIIKESIRPSSKNNKVKEGIRRPEDALIIVEVDYTYLTDVLSKLARWVKFDERSKQLKQKDCPEKIAKTLIARKKWKKIPILTGIIQSPTLRSDGSILEIAGYDNETGLFFEPGNTLFPKISTNPSKNEAESALKTLLELISEFPFENNESRSVAISAILTALVRKSIRTAPLHGFTAPKMSSGKSLLADVVGLITTGKVNSAIPHAENEAEEKKRILAILSEGDPIVCIDNIERPFGSPCLCSILTQEEYKDRVLGSTKNLSVLTNTTFLATGNNLIFVGDISTRAILCRLDPNCERPEERSFDKNLYKYIPKHRGSLVSAAITILRAYYVAGCPKQKIAPFGRFEEWSDLIRSVIVWLGMEDPCKSRKEIENADPVRIALGTLLSAWHDAFGDLSKKIKDVIQDSEDQKLDILRDALIELAPDNKGGINSRSLGKKLSSYKGRIESGYRLDSSGSYQGVDLWRVTKLIG